jgi:hypothetical protein
MARDSEQLIHRIARNTRLTAASELNPQYAGRVPDLKHNPVPSSRAQVITRLFLYFQTAHARHIGENCLQCPEGEIGSLLSGWTMNHNSLFIHGIVLFQHILKTILSVKIRSVNSFSLIMDLSTNVERLYFTEIVKITTPTLSSSRTGLRRSLFSRLSSVGFDKALTGKPERDIISSVV